MVRSDVSRSSHWDQRAWFHKIGSCHATLRRQKRRPDGTWSSWTTRVCRPIKRCVAPMLRLSSGCIQGTICRALERMGGPRRYQQHGAAGCIPGPATLISRHTSSSLSYLLPHGEVELQPKLAPHGSRSSSVNYACGKSQPAAQRRSKSRAMHLAVLAA